MDKLSRYMSEAMERVLRTKWSRRRNIKHFGSLAAMISGSEIRPGRAAIDLHAPMVAKRLRR